MNRFIQVIKDGASKASEKAHNMMEMNRVQAQIVAKRKEWKQNVYDIGELVYDAYKKNDLTLAEEGLKEIAKLNLLVEEEMKLLDWKVSELRKQKRCECGEIAPFSANYCSVCGRKLPEPPQMEEEEIDELGMAFLKAKREEQEEAAAAQEAVRYPEHTDYREHDYTYEEEEEDEHVLEPHAEDSQSSASSDQGRLKQGGAADRDHDDLNVTVGGRRITIMKEEEIAGRRCSNCNSTADEEAKWCERCGTPFV
ncbi:zinc ribbon domain-containing protein [Paenibacillus sp. chi10]|uniref:Zinc ribbon domain-containing protein n=1 Tax=Paenibacillus suaedae TaxID=3077233 RepID=A0AAJ2K096_9BACL|nr:MULTISPECIES: hypothetical protein [unclassified Paenibacillus]MDT8978170.1 zinc ribbon domain-containing protein [Paenibacillus sp. chi10]GAV14933.1 hypothetical protein PBN151_4912 [Paenibacillus sp. NAIST15-1]